MHSRLLPTEAEHQAAIADHVDYLARCMNAASNAGDHAETVRYADYISRVDRRTMQQIADQAWESFNDSCAVA